MTSRSLESKAQKPALLRRRAELHRELAAVDDELAAIEERAARASATNGWIAQSSSPLGKRAHLALWRKLRDEGLDGVRALGKTRLIRADVFEVSLATAPRRRRHRIVPAESGVDLAAAFGVLP